MTHSTKEIIAALQTVSSFVGEDADTFTQEMLNRKSQNVTALFQDAVEAGNCTIDEGLSLRTDSARTTFDSRVSRLVRNAGGSLITAEAIKNAYKGAHGNLPTGPQMRASLNRLIEYGEVEYEGIQRGTKYAAVLD